MSLLFTLREPCHLERGDAVELLNKIDAGSVDLIVTDPPYESLEKYRRIGTTTRLKKSKSSSNVWFPIFPNERMPELFQAMYRVLANNSHLYFHCDAETMFVVKPIGEAAGFKFWKPLVWDKVSIGMGYHYRARYEFVLFFEKGKRMLSDLSIPDVLEHKRLLNMYPTQKPVEIAHTFVGQSSVAGDLVCDPFMGSGTVGQACSTSGRRFLGFDVADEAIRTAEQRLGEMQWTYDKR